MHYSCKVEVPVIEVVTEVLSETTFDVLVHPRPVCILLKTLGHYGAST